VPAVATPVTVRQVLSDLVRHPVDHLILRWNWKSALTSAILRSGIFFGVNLTAGWNEAIGAMVAEFVFRSFTSGFYGAITQSFRKAEPSWLAALTAMVLLPLLSHSLEFLVHWLRGTPALLQSMAASVAFTALSTLFNLHAMRQGALIVGDGRNSLWHDLKQMPRLLASFALFPSVAVWRIARSRLLDRR
jgi:hypothetical protein